MSSKKSSKKELAEPVKVVTSKKKDTFYDSGAFNKILVDALITAEAVNTGEDQGERIKYYVSMADSALKGDTQPMEAMLMAQACTLDLLFNRCIRMARNSEFLNGTEVYSSMVLRLKNNADRRCWLYTKYNTPAEPLLLNSKIMLSISKSTITLSLKIFKKNLQTNY